MRRGTAALAIAILDAAGCAGLIAWSVVPNGPNLFGDPVSVAIVVAVVAGFASTGALLIRRVPTNLVGVLLLATATAQVGGVGLQGYGIVGTAAVPPWPAAAIVSAMTDLWFTLPFLIALVGVPLVFPDGRLPSRRFRWVAWVAVAGVTLQGLDRPALLFPGVAGIDAITGALTAVSVGAMVVGLSGAAVAVWVRFRRGDPVQRQQVKWLLADAGVAVVAFSAAMIRGSTDSLLDQASWVVGFLAFVGLPIAISIAVLRYRLYDIDRIVSRTIGYVIVTVTLAAVFAGAILAFEAVLTPLTGGNAVSVAASTLVAAALFQPLRRYRSQSLAQRRLCGAGKRG